jgi:hypothetical protein
MASTTEKVMGLDKVMDKAPLTQLPPKVMDKAPLTQLPPLPVGVQIVCLPEAEEELLAIALAVEGTLAGSSHGISASPGSSLLRKSAL